MVLYPGFQRRGRENLAPLPRQRTLPSRCVELTLKHPVETTSCKRVQVVTDGENLLTASWVCYTYSLCSTGKSGRWRNSNYIIFFLFPANKTGLSRLKTSTERYFGGIRLIKCHSAPNVFFLYRSKCTAPSRAPTDKNIPWGASGRPWTRFLNVLIVNSNLICHFLFLFFVASSHCGSFFQFVSWCLWGVLLIITLTAVPCFSKQNTR